MPGGNPFLQQFPLRLVPARHPSIVRLTVQRVDANAEHLQDRAGDLGELAVLILLPVPVGCKFGQGAIAGFAFTQFSGALLHLPFQFIIVALQFLVQQAHFEHVADARPDFDQIEGLADEIPRARLQGAHLVAGLRGDHEDRQVGVGSVGLETCDDLESVHAGHLQVEQDQVVGVFTMQRADLLRIHGRGNARVAAFTQRLFQQNDIRLLVVDDQDAGVENLGFGKHHAGSFATGEPNAFNAISSVSMNWATLIGLVR